MLQVLLTHLYHISAVTHYVSGEHEGTVRSQIMTSREIFWGMFVAARPVEKIMSIDLFPLHLLRGPV